MALDLLNIAIVGDEFISRSIHLKSYSNARKIKKVDYICERFPDINEIIKLTDKYLEDNPDVDLVMLFPFLWDIIYMDFDDEIQTQTIHMKNNHSTLNDLVSLITYALKRWGISFPKVPIFWCLPYTPDFYRFNKVSDFWVEQDVGRTFYEIIRKLGCDLFDNVPGIYLLDLHECYFLRNSIYEKSFYPNVREQLRHVNTCTLDGLLPTEEFVSNFASVFDNKVYRVVLELKRKYASNMSCYSSSATTITESSNYSHGKIVPMRVFDYTSMSEKRGNIPSHQNEFDQQYASVNPTFKNNTLFESSLNDSRRLSSELVGSNFNRPVHEHQQYQLDDSDYHKNRQAQSSHQFHMGNYVENSSTSPGFNSNFNQNDENQYIQDVKKDSQTIKTNFPSRSLTEELQSFFDAKDSNMSSSSVNQYNPQHISGKSSEDPSEFVEQLEAPSNVKQNATNNIFENIPEIPPTVLSNLKDALSFLSANKIEKKVNEPTDLAVDKPKDFTVNKPKDVTVDKSNFAVDKSKESTYYELYLNHIFNPLYWKDIFLFGDENVAVDCITTCVASLNKISYKRGITIIMITSSESLIKSCQSALQSLIEDNKIGFNDEIAFGAPLVLIDTPSNLKLRLNQIKRQSLGDLSALIVFGDEFLDMYSLSFLEFSSLVKHLLTSSRGSVNKVVISQSGSADKEISAQSIFNVTFLSPKRLIDIEKEVQKFNNSVGLTDFLMSSSAELEGSGSSCQNSNLIITKEEPEPASEIRRLKSSTKEKHRSTSREKKIYPDNSRSSNSRHKSPNSRDKSPRKSIKSSHSSISSSSSHATSKPTVKLEDLFIRARIPISKEKKMENEAYNKEFMKKLEKMPKSVRKAYLSEGKEVLQEHESIFKTYKDVPDLHPLYEEKYELFTKVFEEAYGKNYKQKHFQTAWKRFWDITISCIKDSEWLDSKKELQRDFMMKYDMLKEEKSKEKDSDKVKSERSEEKIKLKDTKQMVNKGNDAKEIVTTKENEKQGEESNKIEKNKSTKSNDDKIKETLKSDVKNVKCVTDESKNNKNKITESDNKDEDDVIIIDDDEDDKCVKEESKDNNQSTVTGMNKKKEETSEKEKAIVSNNLKKRSISPSPIAESKKKLKEHKDKPLNPSNSNTTDIVPSSEAEPDKKNSNLVKNCHENSSLKTVIEMRRKLIIDADEEDKYNAFKMDDKDDAAKTMKENVKPQVKSKYKEYQSAEKHQVENASVEKKNVLPKSNSKSNIQEISLQALKTLESLIEKEASKLLKKDAPLSGKDVKSSKEGLEVRGKYSALKNDEVRRRENVNYRNSSNDLKRDVNLSSRRREDKSDLNDNYRKKSGNESHGSYSGKTKSSVEKETYSISSRISNTRTKRKKSDNDERKLLFDLENYNIGKHSSKETNLASKLKDSQSTQYKEQNRSSYTKSSPNTYSSKIRSKNPLLSDLTQFSTQIGPPSKEAPSITDFLLEKSNSQKPLFPINIPQKNPPERLRKSITDVLEADEDHLKSIYINTCSELANKKPLVKERNTTTTTTTSDVISTNDATPTDMDDSDFLVHPPISPKGFAKSKIVFNIGKPKIKFSLYEALNALESVCPIIGVMGAALKSIVDSSRALLPNFYEAYKVFADSDSELLVNIAINKLKSFSLLSQADKENYQKTIALSEKLLEEAKKSMQKEPPPSSSRSRTKSPIKSPPVKSRISIEAVAKATVGFSSTDTYQFIKNTFVYKGLTEPSKAEIEQIFKQVSKLHFEYALKT